MNCHLSQLLLAFRPGELAVDDRAALDAHLRLCPACAAANSATTAADAAIRSAMLAVPVPDGLRAKLHASVSAVQGANWRRRAAIWGSSVLAASLLVTLVGSAVLTLSRPVVTTDGVSGHLENERLMQEKHVREWLTAEGVPAELPKPFDFRQHAAHGVGPLGPLKVPFVLFQNDRGQCRVYVLRATAVRNHSGWKDVFGSEFNVQAVERDGFVYLIAVSTGASLDSFLKLPSPVA